MTRQKVIDELFEFRTVLDCCSGFEDICEACPVNSACDRFGANGYEYTLEVIDTAIEMLREDAKKE